MDYIDSYVAFLDVLGFKQMVMGRENDKIDKYFEIVNKRIEEFKNIDNKRMIGNIVISDSVILTVKKKSKAEDNRKLLRQLCIAVSKIQKSLAIDDIWLRGAITTGDTYFNQVKNQIVGPAYINAYDLEENVAKYPRVILENKIFLDLNFDTSSEFINNINMSSANEIRDIALYDWRKNVFASKHTIDQDVIFFIDYLESLMRNPEEFNAVYKNIKKNMYLDTRVSVKYRWVIDYLYTVLNREENSGKIYYEQMKKLDRI